jgi:transcriptional regulator with XRE-family HTH domain
MFYDNLTTHRVAAGIKVAELVRLSGVAETTIRRIEKHEASTEETITKIINALNETKFHSKNPIDPRKEIKKKSRFGSSLQVAA